MPSLHRASTSTATTAIDLTACCWDAASGSPSSSSTATSSSSATPASAVGLRRSIDSTESAGTSISHASSTVCARSTTSTVSLATSPSRSNRFRPASSSANGRIGSSDDVVPGPAAASVRAMVPALAAASGRVVTWSRLWRRPPSLPPPGPAPVRRGPGLDLGRVVSAPLQPARLFPRQPFWLDLAELERHATLVGTTGSGKTTTLGRLMHAAMSAGWAVMVVDAKGGRLANVCRALGAAHSLPARVWLPGHAASWTYDLCAGEPTAVGNRLIGSFDHGREGQVYRNLSQALVPMAARALLG